MAINRKSNLTFRLQSGNDGKIRKSRIGSKKIKIIRLTSTILFKLLSLRSRKIAPVARPSIKKVRTNPHVNSKSNGERRTEVFVTVL